MPQETDKNQSQRQRTVERTACDSGNQGNQANCNESAYPRRRQGGTSQEENPGAEPSIPVSPQQVSPSDSSRGLRMAANRDELDTSDYSSLEPSLMLASDPSRRSLAGSTRSMSLPATGLTSQPPTSNLQPPTSNLRPCVCGNLPPMRHRRALVFACVLLSSIVPTAQQADVAAALAADRSHLQGARLRPAALRAGALAARRDRPMRSSSARRRRRRTSSATTRRPARAPC